METMDIWNWLWVLAFPALLVGAYITITSAGKRALSRHLSEQEGPADEWADWKKLASTTRKRKQVETAEWQKQFLELLQRTCTGHEYDGNRMQGWWKCIHCEHEQEWTYSGGCACKVAHDRSIAGQPFIVLTERNRFCTLHGRAPAVEAIKKFETSLDRRRQ